MVQNNFPKIEEEILKFWQKRQIFKKSLEKPSKQGDPANTAGEFVFYDGPPFATGLPHYGHIIASAIKDVIPRYKTMQGFKVNRRWGWDCHGLPIENLIEKELGLKTKKDIEKLGIDKFNQACRNSVLRYADEWKKFIPRMARWVDMDNDYRTMDNRYIEVIWWIFKQLYDQNLIYEGYKAMHLCPRCETTLSNFEVTLGYKEVKDLAATVKFSIFNFQFSNNFQFSIPKDAKVYLLAWTTTPWTLPGNMALAVGDGIKYQIIKIKSQKSKVKNTNQKSKIKDDYEYYILAQDRIKEIIKDREYKVEGELKGNDLVGLEYEPLFDFITVGAGLVPVRYPTNHPSNQPVGADLRVCPPNQNKNAFKVYPADFVSTQEGTGVVHIAPGFGEDDYQLSQKFNIPFLQHVNRDGTFKNYVKPWACQKVREKDDDQKMNIEIIKWLAHHNQLFAKEKYTHSYPHCWRCDTPLLNYATSSWFVRIDDDFKKRLLKANKKIKWTPTHLRDGRFGKWLEGARDWAISRSRYWGAPLPVWRCENNKCGEVLIIGSVEELIKKIKSQKSKVKNTNQNLKIGDLHRPYIDKIKIKCEKCQGKMKRIEEVFDCWFESGSMPYASGIMFSDYKLNSDTRPQDLLKQISFPADFIAEGIDQTRGWFYTLLVLGVGLYNQSPFKNVAVNGIILAQDGQKMSKRLKNYPNPMSIIDKYGADALRFYLLSSPVVRGESLNFSEKGVDEVYKKVVLLILNVLRFWKQYAETKSKVKSQPCKLAGSKIQIKNQKLNILDQWILARLNQLVKESTTALDNYEIDKACRLILDFIDDLSTWYLRRSRGRFKVQSSKFKVQNHSSKLKIYQDNPVVVLRYILLELSKVLAPICPFLAEHIYQEVGGDKESVHLEQWPDIMEHITHNMEQDKLLNMMQTVMDICELGHSLRSEAGIKVRQSLRNFQFSIFNFQTISKSQFSIFKQLIADELNVKEVEIIDQLPEGDGWISKDGAALYTVIDDELRKEGIVRELTRQINNLRKKQGLTIKNQVILEYASESEELDQIIEKYRDDLERAVLAKKLIKRDELEGEKLNIDGKKILVNLVATRTLTIN